MCTHTLASTYTQKRAPSYTLTYIHNNIHLHTHHTHTHTHTDVVEIFILNISTTSKRLHNYNVHVHKQLLLQGKYRVSVLVLSGCRGKAVVPVPPLT